MADKNTVTLLAGGDIGPIYEPTDEIAELILPVLRQADLRFGQCERTYSERGWPEFISSHGGNSSRLHPRMAKVWETANIDIVSLASNHTMDWGPDALLDTRDMFQRMGKYPIGAGRNGEEARQPAIVERNGIKIAFLGYCSVLRPGHQAAKDKPGCAPLRVHTSYTVEDWQPGTPPRVITTPHKEDLEALVADIKRVKGKVDAVVMSIHWGLHHMPKVICDYQPIVAHAAIDAGADLILGHHAHGIKAVEVYKGKICFYSIGNFMSTGTHTDLLDPANRNVWNLLWFKVEPDCLPPQGRYLFPDDSRRTMLVKIMFGKRGVERVSFMPMYINGLGQPAVLKRDDPKFREIVEFAEWVSDCHPHKFRQEGDEIVVETLAANA